MRALLTAPASALAIVVVTTLGISPVAEEVAPVMPALILSVPVGPVGDGARRPVLGRRPGRAGSPR